MSEINVHILGKGPPLILLHGWGWSSQVWQPVIPVLSTSYTLYLVDLPGHGKNLNHQLINNIDHIGLQILKVVPSHATWLGWSLGGLIALWVASFYPERATSLITVASSPKFVASLDWPGLQLQTLEQFALFLKNDHKKTLLDFLNLQLRGSSFNQALFYRLHQMIETDSPSTETLETGLHLLKDCDLRLAADNVKCPSLHIFGQYDKIVPKEIVPHLFQHYINGSFEILPRSGHMPFYTRTPEFLNLLKNFFLKFN